MTSYIDASPNPVEAGGLLTICYTGTYGSDPVVLTLDWTPTGLTPGSVSLTDADPCETIRVPDAATSLLILGPNADSLGVAIKPPA